MKLDLRSRRSSEESLAPLFSATRFLVLKPHRQPQLSIYHLRLNNRRHICEPATQVPARESDSEHLDLRRYMRDISSNRPQAQITTEVASQQPPNYIYKLAIRTTHRQRRHHKLANLHLSAIRSRIIDTGGHLCHQQVDMAPSYRISDIPDLPSYHFELEILTLFPYLSTAMTRLAIP